MKARLILIPTTIIAMCDAAVGGKVRMNFVDSGKYLKHYYKSLYEPNKVILDFNFLKSLSQKHISFGLTESIKHAFFQSPKLLKYMLSGEFDPIKNLNNFENLQRVILWTLDLKRICLTVDPDESENGAHKIIHAAHTFSNKCEAESNFEISHAEAVGMGLLEEFKNVKTKLEKLKVLYNKLSINLKL